MIIDNGQLIIELLQFLQQFKSAIKLRNRVATVMV